MTFFDAFAGIGGFALALTEAGHECVGFSEIDRYAAAVYRCHFPSHRPYGDITTLDADALPAFALLVGGFPCQAFSVAGKRRGFSDTRGTLFFDLARILQARRPRLCLLENVKGLLSHDDGRTFKTIVATLDELGYDVGWQVLDSQDFGVPQHRERVFLVGHARGTPRPEVFPLAQSDREHPAPCQGARQADPRRAARRPVPFVVNGEHSPAVQGRGDAAVAFRTDRARCLDTHGGYASGQGGVIVLHPSVASCLDAHYGKGPNAGNRSRRTLIARWVNDADGVVVDDTVPTLRASGGTDIRKMPVVLQRARGRNPGGLRGDGLAPTLQKGFGDGNVAILAVNQRREVRKMDVAGALPASQSATQVQVVAIRRQDGNQPVELYPGHVVNSSDGVVRTLKAGVHGVPGGEGLIHDGVIIRRLTPIECERLQGFPDGWTQWGIDERGKQVVISDTQRYKCLGNAVTVNVVRAIVELLPDATNGAGA